MDNDNGNVSNKLPLLGMHILAFSFSLHFIYHLLIIIFVHYSLVILYQLFFAVDLDSYSQIVQHCLQL